MKNLKLLFLFCTIFSTGCANYSASDQKDYPIEQPEPIVYVTVVGNPEVVGTKLYKNDASSFQIRYQFSDNMPRPVKGIVKFQNPADKSKWLEKSFSVSENDPNQFLITQPLPCIDKMGKYAIILTLYNGAEELYTLKTYASVGWQSASEIPTQCNPETKEI
jgi:hypothetical protein